MNKFILLVLITLLHAGAATSQCCPHIDSLKIMPENPTTSDSVYLITSIWFTSGTYPIAYEIVDGPDNDISVRDCYWRTDASVISPFADTFNLGIREEGSYTVDYIGLLGIIPNECMPTDSNSMQISFDVSGISNTNNMDDVDFTCYPNPLKGDELWISSTDQMETIIIMDTQGKVVLRVTEPGKGLHKVDTIHLAQGTYLVKVVDRQNRSTIRKIVKLE